MKVSPDPEGGILPDAGIEEETSGMTDMQKRLFKLRMKINAGRKANKAETIAEFKRFEDPKYDAKQRHLEKKLAVASNSAKDGGDIDHDVDSKSWSKEEELLNVTAEAAERNKERVIEKEKSKATFGWQAFTAEADYRAYKKQLAKLPTNASSSSTVAEEEEIDPLSYGKAGVNVSKAGLDRLSKDIRAKEESRQKHSRRRMHLDGVAVDAINEDNSFFNKKIKRAFDKYTVEIRQNLERGTAL